MIDLHIHILPGLDDGARTVDEALEMAEMAVESGVETLVVTPHSNQTGRFENYSTSELTGAYESFRQALAEEQIPLRILPGMEIFASDHMGRLIDDGLLSGLNHTDYFLVEFPFDAEPWWIGDILEELLEQGRIPLIAHPERYYGVQRYPMLIWEWLQLGCLTQVNKGSVFGYFGRSAQRTAEILLSNDLVTCMASDAHSPVVRTPYMEDTREYLEEWFGERTAYRLLKGNPEIIISNGKVPAHGRKPEKRHWFEI